MAADVVFVFFLFWILGVAVAAFGLPFAMAAALGAGVGAYTLIQGTVRPLVVVLGCAALFCGAWYVHAYANFQKEGLVLPNVGESYTALVVSDARAVRSGALYTLRLNPPFRGTLTALLPAGGDIAYGDRLGLAKKITADERGLFVSFPDVTVLERGQGTWLTARLLEFKASSRAELTRALPAEPAALAAGLLVGDTSGFSADFKQAMVDSGTTHMTALSGYNIMLLIQAVSFALANHLRRRMRFIVTILLILLFVLMVGGEASIVRAAIMGLLLLIARESGRPYAVRNSIAAAAFLMLLIDPFLIARDLGFQLSFVSLLGIVYVTPALMRLFRMSPESLMHDLFRWRENAVLTLGAQLAVLPVLIAAFGTFSPTSIVTNIIALEAVPAAMFTAFTVILGGLVLPPLADLFALIAQVPLAYIAAVVRLGAAFALPFELPASGVLIAFYYAALIAIAAPFLYPSRKHAPHH